MVLLDTVDLKFKVFPDHIYFSLEVPFHIELFLNGVCLGALRPWISLKSRIFPGANCMSVVLEHQFNRDNCEAVPAEFKVVRVRLLGEIQG
jgi:hypothetical protein